METLKIRYLSDKIEKLRFIDGKSDWIDLRSAEEVNMKAGEARLISLGIAVQLPKGYEAGHSQPSFDKQFARDWLTAHPGNDWTLPQEIVDKTIEKYLQSYEMLTGEKLA